MAAGRGYHTGLVGKYLNRYPFGRLPYVPAGWDRFVAKGTTDRRSVYRDFPAVVQGSPVLVRRYATDWLAEHAVRFVRAAPASRPFFLLFAPSAPHPPWTAAPRHAAAERRPVEPEPPNVVGALRGAPPWVRALPTPSAAQRATGGSSGHGPNARCSRSTRRCARSWPPSATAWTRP